MPDTIRRVAVLGAGTMGAAIAAHAANAGLDVDLLDLAPEGVPADRDAVVKAGFERMRKARPAALMSASAAARIRLGNFTDDFDRIGAADWIVEAIIERLEPKRELMQRVEKTASPNAIISSNTSGIPLAQIAEGRSQDFRRRFLGTHFFNPPRYLKLVELIATGDTDPEVAERMRAFLTHTLGKGVVAAKDTPNFIANRIGVLTGMANIRHALDHGYTIEEVDELTGPLIGWPKTATFRLQDQVGLDIMTGVADNLYDLAPHDESRELLHAPEPLRRMLDAKVLGIKTGGGFYKRDKRDGQTVFDVLDLDTLTYRPAAEPDLPVVAEARQVRDLGERLRLLMDRAETDRGARFLRDTILPALAYAARRVPEIADSPLDVDRAMEWGFGHATGPFRTWDLLGVPQTVARMDSLGIEVAEWVRRMLLDGHDAFYRTVDGAEQVYIPETGGYVPVEADPDLLDLATVKARQGVVAGNASASLVDLGDGVLCFELHSQASAIDQGVIETGMAAIEQLDSGRWRAMVIANQAANFCVGANIGEFGMAAYAGQTDQLHQGVRALQVLLMGLRYAPVPVVAAPHGQVLGGGAEICMHADRVVASAETYVGLVEVGVGVIPAGGGCKELLRRIVSPAVAAAPGAEALPYLQRVFETIGTAKVSTSAIEARELGFFDEDDRVVMHPDHLLAAAKREALALAEGYEPPARAKLYAAGATALAALELGVQTMRWGGYASEHDAVIGKALARVLTGGELSSPQWLDEQHFLDLEREAFVALAVTPKSLERIQAMLMTRKPLRN
jgi:3-hydroxyacyl-CoA dehydrogenase